MNTLQEKYDKMDRKFRKMSADNEDILRDRDGLNAKCSSLERIIRENNEHDMNAINDEMDELKAENEKLRSEIGKLKKAANKLEAEYAVLDEKYILEKEAFKKAIEKHQIDAHFRDNEQLQSSMNFDAERNEEIRKLRDQLNKEKEIALKQREEEWTKAKNENIKILDKEYKQIKEAKDKQIAFLEQSNGELKVALDDKKKEIARLKNANEQMDDLKDRIRELNDSLNDKAAELLKLKTELSKYKILWQHFFGLDAPLKDEIEKVNKKLDKFESHHGIQSPIPKKKRRVIIESLSQWTDRRQPPLILDAIPAPNDEYQRFELYNIHNKVIELKGFKLMNGFNQCIDLESRQIKPGGFMSVALKKRKNRFDILYNGSSEFCKFTDGEVIWLCDSFDDKLQIFPITEVIYDNLTSFQGRIGAPIFVKQLFVEEEDYKGFEFGNQTKRKIKLKNMCFKNKQNTLRVEIPFKSLPRNGVIKLIITDKPNHPKVGRNDLIVSSDKILQGVDDALLLCDSFGNEIELYNLDGTGLDASPRSGGKTRGRSECFIM